MGARRRGGSTLRVLSCRQLTGIDGLLLEREPSVYEEREKE
jgi:hypothetical protein